MGRRTSFIIWFWCGLFLLTSGVTAQTIYNPGFEPDTYGWTAYSYVPGAGTFGVEPTAGCIGPSPCTFDLLNPGEPPEGNYVCGIQSSQTNGNGGVCQAFYWSGGPTFISVDARNYSETPLGVPEDGGGLVRMGLAPDYTMDRQDVTSWVTFPWSSDWQTRQVIVPGEGLYTLFIEAYQPNSSYIFSTLWDNVRFGEPVNITYGPNTSPNPVAPETSIIVTWTTDVPSTSRVDYGSTGSYGRSVSSNDMTTFHSVTITGLTRSSRYHYRVTSTSGDYSCQSEDDTFNTPIQLIDFNLSLSQDNSVAYISWMTDVPTDAQVEYWPTNGVHQIVTEEAPMGYEHSIVLELEVGKEYHFIATSRGSSPYTSVSTSGKFFTLPPVSTTLMNGGFEDTDEYGQHTLYPWVQYTIESGVPAARAIDGLIGPYPHDGIDKWNAGIRAYNGAYFLGAQAYWSYKNGGVFQRVSVTPGQYYVLSVRFITHRVGGEDGYNRVRIGVDPTGGTDASSPNITWWSMFSNTNDNQWHIASGTLVAGSGGVATVFVEFRQQMSLEWHVTAVDGVSFYPPSPISVGALKSSQWSLGAVLDGKIVTYGAFPVWCDGKQYSKVYVQEDNRSSGIAVLFPYTAGDLPAAGDKLTVTGALGEYNKEAGLLAEVWTVDRGPVDPISGLPQGYALPKALALNQKMLGTRAVNQPPLFSNNSNLCTIGLRVRMYGRVTWVSSEGSPGDVVAYIDDGGGILDGSGNAGVRAYLPGKGTGGIHVGDYVAATGVIGVDFVNPDHWPDPTDFYAHSLFVNSSDDYTVIPGN